MNVTHIKPMLLATTALLSLLVLTPSGWAVETGARIVSLKGTVEVSGHSPGAWIAAQPDRVVRPGDSIRTGDRSSAVLQLDGARISLYETTLLKIPRAATTVSTDGATPFRHPLLEAGRALFNVTPQNARRDFSVRTPMLVAGVKGTIFEVIHTETEQAVYVWEGAVEVHSMMDPTDMQMVAAGEYTLMDDHRLMPHAEMPAERERPEGAYRDRKTPAESLSAPKSDHVINAPRPIDQSGLDRDAVSSPTDTLNRVDQSSDAITPDLVSDEPTLTTNFDGALDAWRDADRAAVDLANAAIADVQTVISNGDLRFPVPSGPASDTLTSANTVTTPPGTNLPPTNPLASNTSPNDPLTSTAVVDPLTGTAHRVVDSVTGLLGP